MTSRSYQRPLSVPYPPRTHQLLLPVDEIFSAPKHPYTKHLIASEPKGNPPVANPKAPIVMETDDLKGPS